MKELIIEFGNDTLGETRMYQRNSKGYEQAVKDMKLYKAQQKAEIDYLKAKITAERKRRQEAMKVAEKTINKLEKALELACEEIESEYMYGVYCTEYPKYFKAKAEEMMKSE